jgi:hypothetical protein
MPSATDANSAKNNSKGWENIEGWEDGQEEGFYEREKPSPTRTAPLFLFSSQNI